ncbi:MAG: transketolase [Elusimicrobia bacterium]|nr:transketolase [Elusimicrobiota bacterium]
MESASQPKASTAQLSIDTIRTLSIDAVQQAKSGHPGAPMGLAALAYTLWQEFLRYDPADPIWPNRDRFVLSAGHASMLLYSLLHLADVQAVDEEYNPLGRPAVSLDEIKRFRQLDSATPGHPEYRWTTGVETTTGPLGQGLGVSVGMAIAQRWLAAQYNRPGFEIFDYDVYSICGDGCMMEGVTGEAASLAAHLKLANLCWIYDSNRITIEGKTDLAFSENVAERFKGYGWNVLHVKNANDSGEVGRALSAFQDAQDRPTLIIAESHIGFGAPKKQDTAHAHGEPLGDDEVRGAKQAYGWPADAKFLIPSGVKEDFARGIGRRGGDLRSGWQKLFAEYKTKHPELADQIERMQRRELPAGWDKDIPSFPADEKGLATRASSGKVLNAVAKNVPWLIGGSADLAPSTMTLIAGSPDLQAATPEGRNLRFGIREHAMGAALNGLAHSKVRAFGATFLNFLDYCRPSVRLAALMEIPTIYVFTHDSIGLGEDGPTHQPIEHLAGMRATPGLLVLRPADANEVAELWRVVMPQRRHPAAFVLSRQATPTIDRTKYAPASGAAKGAYVVADAPDGKPQVLLLATGTEVAPTLAAYEALKAEGVAARVVSMPSWELFEQQSDAYKASVLPAAVTARVSVEAASPLGWERYIGMTGQAIGMRRFGASAPAKDLERKFGFTAENIAAAAKAQIAKAAGR